MTAFVLSNSAGINWSNDFDAALHVAGLPRISRFAVLWHQFKMIAAMNPGPWLLVYAWYAAFMFVISWMVTGGEDVDDAGSYIESVSLRVAGTIAGLLFLAVAAPITVYFTGSMWAWWLAAPLMAIVVSFILAFLIPYGRMVGLNHFWMYQKADIFFSNEGSVPAVIRERCGELERLDNVDPYVLHFANDPFLVAVEKSNKPWFLRRKRFISAWNTVTPMDLI